jgi:formamidopyrimidine-DNA glycosylase
MPGLPELEVVRRDLEKEIVGRRIKDVEVRPGGNAMKIVKRHGRRKEVQDLLVGARLDAAQRLGRWLVLELDTDRSLVVDLGATGSLFKTSASDPIAPHTHIVIGFTIGGQLRMVDPKLTGELFVAGARDVENADGAMHPAVDPLDAAVAWQRFSALLEEAKAPMKELLLDPSFISELGDVYSDEVLFTAGLRYDRLSHQLSTQDVRRLYRALIETMHEAVKARGTTCPELDFKDLHGQAGSYQLELKVFGREGESCRRCRTAIAKASVDSGHTYFCPQCQS